MAEVPAARDAWIGPYCRWRNAIAFMDATGERGFEAGYKAALDAGARAGDERARAIEECARMLCTTCENRWPGMGLNPVPVPKGDYWLHESLDGNREPAQCWAGSIRALLPPATPERGEGPGA